jgi:hypothetical protein
MEAQASAGDEISATEHMIADLKTMRKVGARIAISP